MKKKMLTVGLVVYVILGFLWYGASYNRFKDECGGSFTSELGVPCNSLGNNILAIFNGVGWPAFVFGHLAITITE